jgi:hypothetical protein
MDGSILQLGLAAIFCAMILVVYEMGAALRPVTCPECSHCQARRAAEERAQELLNREYARRVGLHDEDDDQRRLG